MNEARKQNNLNIDPIAFTKIEQTPVWYAKNLEQISKWLTVNKYLYLPDDEDTQTEFEILEVVELLEKYTPLKHVDKWGCDVQFYGKEAKEGGMNRGWGLNIQSTDGVNYAK